MPNLPTHIRLATAAAARLRHPDVESQRGYFALGATAPDIRALTKRARSEYHFVELDFETIGTGVKTMFAAYPELMNAAEHDGPTRAFMAGYITHLMADESYITRMFRPYFGVDGVFEDKELAKVLDRAMQLDFDRQVWDDARLAIAGRGDGSVQNQRPIPARVGLGNVEGVGASRSGRRLFLGAAALHGGVESPPATNRIRRSRIPSAFWNRWTVRWLRCASTSRSPSWTSSRKRRLIRLKTRSGATCHEDSNGR